MEFPCSQCGKCCQNVSLAVETQFLDRGDGTCKYFDDNSKLCLEYQRRPDICNIALQYQLHYQKHYTWPVFVELNLRVCDYLQKET